METYTEWRIQVKVNPVNERQRSVELFPTLITMGLHNADWSTREKVTMSSITDNRDKDGDEAEPAAFGVWKINTVM